MSSSVFKSLDKSLRQIFRNATNVQVQKDHLAYSISRTGFNAGKMAKSLRELNNLAFDLIRDISALEAMAKEAQEEPIIADEIAGAIASLQLVDELQRLDYIGLARNIENAEPDIIKLAIQEVATFETGLERLEAIREALREVEESVAKREKPVDPLSPDLRTVL